MDAVVKLHHYFNYLFWHYVILEWSMSKIVKDCEVSHASVRHYLKKFNIPRRPEGFVGKHHTEETKQKLSKARKGKYTGVNNSNWKNWEELSGLSHKHRRIEQELANMKIFKPKCCPVCNVIDKCIDLMNLDHQYSENPLDYYYLCRYCHNIIYHCLVGFKKSKKIPVNPNLLPALLQLEIREEREELLKETLSEFIRNQRRK